MSELEPIVEIKDLTKRFDKKTTLDSVNLDIFPSRIIGLLGPNGCGKSTLIRHIVGLYLPTSGSCSTFGCDAGKLGPRELSRIGYVHQESELLDWMTVGQMIGYVSAHYPNWNKDLGNRYLSDFGIMIKDHVGSLSPGQRQKLAILLAIGHEPDLLILDEPASALDPIARAQFLELLLKIIQMDKKTILITSHILTDVEKVIDHVIIMKGGRIVVDQGLDDLRERYLRVRLTGIDIPLPERLPFETVLSCHRDSHQAILTLDSKYFESTKCNVNLSNYQIESQNLPLEDIYKIIMGPLH
jgi:ABC-2 type transport system ATP-binding protein